MAAMATSFREAFVEAGVELAPVPESDRVPDDGPPRPVGWGYRLGIPEPTISRHAAQRYRERFGNRRDSLDVARDQLRARLDYGNVTFSRDRPDWLVLVPSVGGQNLDNSAGFLIVDGEMLLPLRRGSSRSHPFFIVTCIARI
jgi:hypothetical protein